MELLTDRLSFLMNQVAQNQIEEIVTMDKMQKQRLLEKEQRSKMLSYKTAESLYHIKQHRTSSIRGMISSRKKKEEQEEEENNEENKAKPKIATLSSIWGAKKTFEKGAADKGGNTKSHKVEKVEAPTSKFKRAAKFAVLINSVKQGRDICTCESLDARCKIHDT